MAQTTDLGTLIMALNPYTNNRWVSKGGPNTGEMDVFTLNSTPNPGGANGGTIPQIQLEVDATYAGEWTFKGQPHRLGKAARMKYRFPVMDTSPGAAAGAVAYWVEDYVLIGFEDGGI
jgi:hypothetical protein